MSDAALSAPPLSRLLDGRPRALRVAVVLAGSWLLAASSWAAIPMPPVPMTLQTLALLAIAGLGGARLSVEIVLVWLLQAAIGLPVLAEGAGGLAALAGPTAGYLAGFLAAAAICGRLAERARLQTLPGLFVIGMLGHALVLALGWAWLARLLGPEAALAQGVLPFLAGAVVKSAAAAVLIKLAQPRRKAA